MDRGKLALEAIVLCPTYFQQWKNEIFGLTPTAPNIRSFISPKLLREQSYSCPVEV
jgi:hypothetical protein